MLIKCSNSKEILTSEGRDTLMQYTSKLKPGEEFYLQPISKAKARSLEQNSYYWKVLLPCMCYYIEWLDFITDTKSQSETAHLMVKLQYCSLERPDLIKTFKVRDPKSKKMITKHMPFSWKLSEASRKEANAFIDFCKRMVEQSSGLEYEDALRSIV